MSTTVAERETANWIPDDNTFGARLALIRQHMGWGNVKEAAIACGLPAESWRTWERDNVFPRRYPEVGLLISQRTGVDYDWLLRGRRSVTRAYPTLRRPPIAPPGRPSTDRRPAAGPPGRRTHRLTPTLAA